jgi:hypothetical protein
VVLVSPGCHLCDVACDVVDAVCAETDVAWVSRDLSEVDPLTRQKWRDFTPVIVVDGEVFDYFRVSADRLRARLG